MSDPARRIRTVVVDDEPLAREQLLSLLAGEPDIEVVGEAGGGSAAIQVIGATRPDLVFLDVQMPGCDGFEVVSRVASTHLPVIVFVTAFDAHAVQAFEVAAVDYLLKPVMEPRFRAAVRRAVAHVAARDDGRIADQLALLLERSAAARGDRIAVPNGDGVTLVRPGDIDWIDAADDEIRLHVGTVTHTLRETMTRIERRLPPEFMRIHRSIIVNVERVREVRTWFKGDYVLVLTNDVKLTSGRTYRERVRSLMK